MEKLGQYVAEGELIRLGRIPGLKRETWGTQIPIIGNYISAGTGLYNIATDLGLSDVYDEA